jgi:uncharacterized membrane protein YdjX (TVP38/TMEM64 family)
MRLVLFCVGIALVMAIPFLWFGAELEQIFDVAWLQQFGRKWGWLIGLALLAADLLLPLPSTVIMSGLGYLYGTGVGGCLAATGSFLAGILGYLLCRGWGERMVRRLAGEEALTNGRALFLGQSGPWLVALSRWLPLLPEVVACVAGMMRMPLAAFAIALACGSIPVGFAFAWIGAQGITDQRTALIGSAVLPLALMGLAARLRRRIGRRAP